MQSIKKFVSTVFEKINKVSILGQKYGVIDPQKGDPMHQSRRGFHHLIGINVPFHHAQYKGKTYTPFGRKKKSFFVTYRESKRHADSDFIRHSLRGRENIAQKFLQTIRVQNTISSPGSIQLLKYFLSVLGCSKSVHPET